MCSCWIRSIIWARAQVDKEADGCCGRGGCGGCGGGFRQLARRLRERKGPLLGLSRNSLPAMPTIRCKISISTSYKAPLWLWNNLLFVGENPAPVRSQLFEGTSLLAGCALLSCSPSHLRLHLQQQQQQVDAACRPLILRSCSTYILFLHQHFLTRNKSEITPVTEKSANGVPPPPIEA